MCLPRHDPEIHGESGLGGTDLLPPVDADDDILFYPAGAKAIAVMAETILSNPDPVCLVVIGPMTNVALLLSVYPEVVPRIRSLAFMGGTLKGGNRSPVAEFNILASPTPHTANAQMHVHDAECDPEAAQIVLTSGIKEIAMIPLDVTHMTLTTKQVLETLEQKIKPINPRFYQMLRELLCFFNQTYCEVFGFKEGSPLHDPNAVAYLIDPTIYDRKLMRVDVECASTLCYGQTICDIWEQSPLPKNCWVTTSVDVDKFWELMMDAWKQAAKASPL
ncbi:Uridine nucleosidase 1 [Spiromyces aspiralis]|uniref:Uridine nucleosidase 1 n=1 Tax=Spiromyces aspiralis TaxID=68401 RepID=A0ACC1HK11_9FUNG|nr:Uridine nucleosidase 1 [Spiromyces aspiralis]